ncbi:MAG: glutaredoxin family protein [Bacillota bacterium]|uniref:Glutaredoxin family protein n=1 Tax=Virgibacillus salarius TaxID=447199 RepID=A0A941DST0_9BACI|nr:MULTISPECIES: glutaredoxin family protein [Bacillaceae]NAZ08667.1 glutaredoxin family protein [Agaribacter marinus]MBR7795955.1 glutaredoxin family protein [Virgibacillus salarius]MCC2248734.1 glutaredoxin family protein [Virgibacillus sp. AGTR]MDY7043972.1 glutaredoxin family protein [Virgibacillus sp. M23]QRZ17974.1 glutaredoxin family protein [Virgibacillus sp. AGTR]
MLNIILYTKDSCPLCDDAKFMLEVLQRDYPFKLEERDIYTNDKWLETYQLLIPCVVIDDISIDAAQLNFAVLSEALEAKV